MLSLDNAFSIDDLKDFEKRNLNKLKENVDFSYLVEPKIDGVAISLFYQNGKLIRAGTRGDGLIGKMSLTVLTMSEIPTTLKKPTLITLRKLK